MVRVEKDYMAGQAYGYVMELRAKSLLSRPYVRVLLALRNEGPLRFNQLKEVTGLNPNTLDRILTAFIQEHFAYARALPAEGKRIPAQYELAPRGEALLKVHEARAREAERHERVLGKALVEELLAEG